MQKNSVLPKGTKVPDHIAIIPDGNRRWARARGLHTLKGHKKGFEVAISVGRAARQWGVHTVTLYGFSTENWDRTEEEIKYLMRLYRRMLKDYLRDAHKEEVRIKHIGRKDRLPKILLEKLKEAEEETKHYTKYQVNIALDYGGHNEIIRGIQKMIEDGVKSKDVSKKLMEQYLDTADQPYPYVDLMIRTSGEQRTSGFMMWQAEYCEFYFENDHFPDFSPKKLRTAILDYSRRRRRYGGNDAEDHFKFRPEVTAQLELNWWRLKNIPEGTKFADYAMQHIKEQYGLSKELSIEAAKYLVQAILEGESSKWEKAKRSLGKFYGLIKDEVKLAFEPRLAAGLQVKFWREINEGEETAEAVEDTARKLYSEVYRISFYQAAKVAHLRVLADRELRLAENGKGEHHWKKAEDYLERYYRALKERIA